MNEPLIVLNALVIRADSSPPLAHRAARPAYNVNRAGLGIEEAGTQDRVLALTERPQWEWEAFDEYWRKMHGPKILHVDGAQDRQTGVLHYYLQQHRIPGGPSSSWAPPYRPMVDADERLVRDPAARCPTHQRPAWDGVAQLGYRSRADLLAFFDLNSGKYREKIIPDEAVFIRGFGFHLAEEHVILEAANRRRDPIILIRLHARNSELTRAQFRGRWMAQHAEIVRRAAAADSRLRRYAQLVNISEVTDTLYDPVGDRYDGVSVMSFANMNDIEEFMSSEAYARIQTDEAEFARETLFYTALNYVIHDAGISAA